MRENSPSTKTLEILIIGACVEIRKLEYQYANDPTINETGHHDDKVNAMISMRNKCTDEIIKRENNDKSVQDSRDG